MRKHFSFVTQAVATAAFTASILMSAMPASATVYTSLSSGDLIKLPDDGNSSTVVDTAVYYFGADGLRYVFPDSKTYFTWYSNFSNIKVVSAAQLGTVGIGGNVSYRPGKKLIKITSDPKVYAVDRGGTRRWISTEAVAISLYGANWNKQVDDVPDAFIRNYPLGNDINVGTDFSVANATDSNPTINIDKQLGVPVEISITSNGFSQTMVSVSLNHTIRWTNNTGADVRVISNPPDLPGLDSAYIPAGLSYVYKFKELGQFTYHNYSNPSIQGTVTVVQ